MGPGASWLIVWALVAEPAFEDGWARQSPNLELSSAFFTTASDLPGRRSVLSFVLRAESQRSGYDISYGASLGWVTLSEPSAAGSLRTSGVSNALFFANYHFELGDRTAITGKAGVGLAIGLTATAPEPYRRVVRAAYGHGIAMQGVWDAWLWAPERGGFVVPASLSSVHRIGGWHGRAGVEAVFVFTMPDSEAGDSDPGRVVQLGAEYALWPRRWLEVGARYHFVWFPSATLFHSQSSAVPFAAVVVGRWRIGAEAVLNLDEPYGFGGQRIWAALLKAGLWW
jgi:hypothetical protein